MHDPELQASLERINDRHLWTAGWFLCAVATLFTLAMIAEDWHLRNYTGKLLAGALVAVLIAFPTSVITLKKRKWISASAGTLLFGAYMLLLTAIQAFGPLARAR